MTEIDPVSSALGRIESKCDNLLEQNKVLFHQVSVINENGCNAFRQTHNDHKKSASIFGAAAGTAIATAVEAIRHFTSK